MQAPFYSINKRGLSPFLTVLAVDSLGIYRI